MIESAILIPAAIFIVAVLYSSVGHGGASGYLAVLSLTAFLPAEISSTALLLNILVAGMALISFVRAGHLSVSITWPFVMGSVPAAFLGGLFRIPDQTYFVLVAMVLVFAAIRIILPVFVNVDTGTAVHVRKSTAIPVGVGIGLFSGIVGVGGGIFLSPLMMLRRWATVKQTAATAACFVTVNSASGLVARIWSGTFNVGETGFWPVMALAGGLLGSYLGARRLPIPTLRVALAMVLLFAAAKLVMNFGT